MGHLSTFSETMLKPRQLTRTGAHIGSGLKGSGLILSGEDMSTQKALKTPVSPYPPHRPYYVDLPFMESHWGAERHSGSGMEAEKRQRTPEDCQSRSPAQSLCSEWPPAPFCPAVPGRVWSIHTGTCCSVGKCPASITANMQQSQDQTPVCLQRPFPIQLRTCLSLFGLIKQAKRLLPRMLFWEESQAVSNDAEYFPCCCFYGADVAGFHIHHISS